MNGTMKNWVWFSAIIVIIIGLGIYLGTHRRAELGGGFEYSLDEFRKVDPLLIHYKEATPLEIDVEELSALAVTPSSVVYVAGKDAVKVYPAGQTIAVDGSPTCLEVDSYGVLYVGFTDHIEIIPQSGERSQIEVPSERAYLTSLAVNEDYIFAADAGSRKIWRFSREGGEPFEIGRPDGASERGFNVPSSFFDIALARNGKLLAVNPGYHALEYYSVDGTRLTYWEKNADNIFGFVGCCNPSHIALLRDGAVVTSEKGIPRVKVYEPDGSMRCVVAIPDQFKDDVVGLDLATDRSGRIYVLDPARKQVRVFEEK
jgi:hypothetical protein